MTTNQTVIENSIHRVNLESFLKQQAGKFVGLDFIKADNQPRRLIGRLGVTAPLKGGTNKTVADDRPYITMYDVKNGGYRTVNLATVSSVRAKRKAYSIIG